MEPEIIKAAEAILQAYEQTKNTGRRTMIAIAGVPGAGKSTIAPQIVQRVNDELLKRAQGERAVVVPMDGFHYYRHELDAFPNPEEAHRRRGAPFTFDSEKLLASLQAVRNNATEDVYLPTFDHAQKDPKEKDLHLSREAQICVWEGIYLLLSDLSHGSAWPQVASQFDCKIYLDIDLDRAMERVAQRHMKAWGWSREPAWERAIENDRPNALIIEKTKSNADLVLHD
eukprot:PhF_6_TR28978/c0_g1_i1/m.42243